MYSQKLCGFIYLCKGEIQRKENGSSTLGKLLCHLFCMNALMILVKGPKVNVITQSYYDSVVNMMDCSVVRCPSCEHTGTIIHGYYTRKLKTVYGVISLRIMRVKCSTCGKTHAVLLCSIVPYSMILLEETIDIISADNTADYNQIMELNIHIDLSDIYRVRRNYRLFWKERVKSFGIEITDPQISAKCISIFQRQFMQIPCTLCALHMRTHII